MAALQCVLATLEYSGFRAGCQQVYEWSGLGGSSRLPGGVSLRWTRCVVLFCFGAFVSMFMAV